MSFGTANDPLFKWLSNAGDIRWQEHELDVCQVYHLEAMLLFTSCLLTK
jgi:hypothetical protein